MKNNYQRFKQMFVVLLAGLIAFSNLTPMQAQNAMTQTDLSDAGGMSAAPAGSRQNQSIIPPEMQQEIIHQQEVAAQISESGLDPEALAALPEDLRREVIEEEQNQQRLRDEQASRSVANPANVEEMDNAR